MTIIPTTTPPATSLLPDFYPIVRVASTKTEPPRRIPLDKAHKYPFWQPNDHNTMCVIVVDIDSDNWELPMWEIITQSPQLMPSWIIQKASNGHGQLGWIIERVALGENARKQPIQYANAVRYALTAAFGGDQHFSNSRCWNPTYDGWGPATGEVTWGIVEPRSLGSLREALCGADLWVSKPQSHRPMPILDPADAPGRNCHVFDAARLRTAGTVADAAHSANNALANPLPPAEVATIIRSIEGWEAKHGPPWNRKGSHSVKTMTDEQRERLREYARRGGLANTEKQKQARAKGPAASAIVQSAEAVGRAATAREYRQHGLTVKEIAEKMNVHPRSVRRWFQKTQT